MDLKTTQKLWHFEESMNTYDYLRQLCYYTMAVKWYLSEELKEDEMKYPLKRYGQPEDIANLAVYLLSDASSWMTGSNVKITGGYLNSS